MRDDRRPTLVLDVDDTLVATFRVGYRKCCIVAERLGLPCPRAQQLAALYGRLPFRDCIRRLHPDVDLDLYQATYDGLVEALPAEALCDGPVLIAAARAAGFGIGVFTNGPGHKTARKLATVGLDADDLDFVAHQDNFPIAKPAPSAFRELATSAGLDPAASWYVSDAAADWRGSEVAGFGSVGVVSGLVSGFGWLPGVLVPELDALVGALPALREEPIAPRRGSPAAVTFDAGFTLVDHVRSPEQVVADRLEREGVRLRPELIESALAAAAPLLAGPESVWSEASEAASRLAIYYRTVVRRCGVRRAASPARDIVASYTDPSNWRARPGAHEAVAAVRGAGWPVAVLANWQHSLSEVLTSAGLHDAMDRIVPSTLVGSAKPSREAFAAAAAALGVAVDGLVHVGDDVETDVAGVLWAGGRAVFVPRTAPASSLVQSADVLAGLPADRSPS